MHSRKVPWHARPSCVMVAKATSPSFHPTRAKGPLSRLFTACFLTKVPQTCLAKKETSHLPFPIFSLPFPTTESVSEARLLGFGVILHFLLSQFLRQTPRIRGNSSLSLYSTWTQFTIPNLSIIIHKCLLSPFT